jgi:hypothetical protein
MQFNCFYQFLVIILLAEKESRKAAVFTDSRRRSADYRTLQDKKFRPDQE